jgi:hypothetical protein
VLVSVSVVRGLPGSMGAILIVVHMDYAGGSVFAGFMGVAIPSCPRFSPSKRSLMVWSMAVVPRSVASVVGSRVLWLVNR